jgi:hypothetical protein
MGNVEDEGARKTLTEKKKTLTDKNDDEQQTETRKTR